MRTIDSNTARWLDALVGAADELARDTLGWGGSHPSMVHGGVPREHAGALVSVATSNEVVQVGLLAAPVNCGRLAKALLNLGGASSPAGEDVAAAMCEAVQLLARFACERRGERCARVGATVFVDGDLSVPDPRRHRYVDAVIGDVSVKLVMIPPPP